MLQQALFLAVGAIIAMVACVIDLRTRRIPNLLNLTGAGLIILLLLINIGLQKLSMVSVLAGALAGAGVPLLLFPLFMLRALGAGDIKLMMVLGLLLGPRHAFYLLLATLVCGGGGALLVFAYKTGWSGLKNLLVTQGVGLWHEPAMKIKFPYSAAILLGYLLVVGYFRLWSCDPFPYTNSKLAPAVLSHPASSSEVMVKR